MTQASFYPQRPRPVEVKETHISWVFLAGDLAYKVKKAVRFPFVDYGSLERRRRMCEEEVRLNRRLTEGIYLGVRSIVESGTAFRFGSGSERQVAEWAVEMRRLPADRTLDRLLERGALRADQIRAVGGRLARFHAEAERVGEALAAVARARGAIDENFETLARLADPGLGPRLAAGRRFSDAFLEARGATLLERARAGRIRDGHGDLRLEHVVMSDGVQVFDCVEFDPDLRRIDVGADLAFLVMDLAFNGREDLADQLLRAYRAAGGDPGDDAAIWFWSSYRALVRAKVALLRREQLPQGRELQAAKTEADRLFDLAERLRWRARLPLLLVICGVTATGKTTLASAVAERSGLAAIGSDPVRKRLAGIAPTERGAPGLYTNSFSRRTYAELGTLAKSELARGCGAIVDATFRRRSDRDAFTAALGPHTPPVLYVECRAPVALLSQRAQTRERSVERTSDATAELVERQLEELEPIDEVAAEQHVVIETDRPVADLIDLIEEFLDLKSRALCEPPDARPHGRSS